MRISARSFWLPLIATSLSLAAPILAAPASAVTVDWVTVGDPGNICNLQPGSCFGAVSEVYRIARTGVTNAEYAEFLNAKASSDPLGLYNTSMASAFSFGGITRSGSDGSYTYSAIPGRENMPVNHVSFYDAVRFANWLHNGQGSGDTETGAYTLLGGTAIPSNGFAVTRNADATVFIPSENEWYKAAYYDAGTTSYYDYPAGTNAPTVCAAPGGTPNTANCFSVVGDLTDVGSYTGSPSPAGTFDQGGNLFEWNDTINGIARGLRGGSFGGSPNFLAASFRVIERPEEELVDVGFRVASPVPVSPLPSLSPLGMVLLWVGLIVTARQRIRT